METIQQRVDRGVAWLDKNHPGWADRIDLNKFEMNNCFNCVMGQLTGDFNRWHLAKNKFDFRIPVDLGFLATEVYDDQDPEYLLLQEEWQRRIVRRRLANYNRRACQPVLEVLETAGYAVLY